MKSLKLTRHLKKISLSLLLCLTIGIFLTSCQKAEVLEPSPQNDKNPTSNSIQNKSQSEKSKLKDTDKPKAIDPTNKSEKNIELNENKKISANTEKAQSKETNQINCYPDTVPLEYVEVLAYDYKVPVEASSTLPSQSTYTYQAENINDFDYNTVWSEGVKGNGIGEYITFKLENNPSNNLSQYSIERLNIVNGYAIDNKLYEENNRVKTLKIFVDGSYHATINLEDIRDMQSIEVPAIRIRSSTTIKCVIEDIYPGTKYDDTVLTECLFCIIPKYAKQSYDKSKDTILVPYQYVDVKMVLDDGSTGIFSAIAQNHLLIDATFTSQANRSSVEKYFKEHLHSYYPQEIVTKSIDYVFEWKNDRHAVIDIKLKKGTEFSPEIHFACLNPHNVSDSSVNYQGIPFIQKTCWFDDFNHVNLCHQNKVIKMNNNGNTLEIIASSEFPFIHLDSENLSPDSNHFVYYDHYETHPMGFNTFRPMVFDLTTRQWYKVDSDIRYDTWYNYKVRWLKPNLFLLGHDLFNGHGEVMKRLKPNADYIEGFDSPYSDDYLIFSANVDQELKLEIYGEDIEQPKLAFTLPFTYRYGVECNHLYDLPLKCYWMDKEHLVVEGTPLPKNLDPTINYPTNTDSRPNLFRVNLSDGSVQCILPERSIKAKLSDNHFLIDSAGIVNNSFEYIDISENMSQLLNAENIYYDGSIAYFISEITEGKSTLKSYDFDTDTIQTKVLDGTCTIIGIQDHNLYINIQ